MSRREAFTVSGPGRDRTFENPDHGLSAAITYASSAAHRREDATYYVRDSSGTVVGRTEGHADGSVDIYPKEIA